MKIKMKAVTMMICLALVCCVFAQPAGAVVLCSWEQTPDGCIDWSTKDSIDDAALMPSVYDYENTVGVTHGNYSLKVVQDGVGQNLTIALDVNQRAALMSNNRFEIDFSVAPGTAGGRLEIYEVAMNTPGGGFDVIIDAADGYHFDMWNGSPERTMTIAFEYDPDQLAGGGVPGYCEIVFSLNGIGGQTDFYFDNARLSYEAPVSVVLASWEQVTDGAMDWNNNNMVSIDTLPAKYMYESAIGVTDGDYSLKVVQADLGQNLTLVLDAAQREALLENNRFEIDFSVAPGTSGGRLEIYEIVLNTAGYGFGAPVITAADGYYFDMWDGSSERTMTVAFDYDPEQIGAVPDFCEIVFSLNGYLQTDFYFDYARLRNIPQPVTGLLGSYTEEVQVDDPILWLRFEEEAAVDSSSNNYLVGYRADTSLVVGGGIVGNCRFLDDGSNNAVWASVLSSDVSWGGEFDKAYAFDPNAITFEFWYNTNETDLQDYGMFFQQVERRFYQAPGLSNSEGQFRILTGQYDPTDPDEDEQQQWWYTNVEVPADDQWHHVVVTYETSFGGDPDRMKIQLFLDGQFRNATVVGTVDMPATLGPELDHLVIGGSNNRGYTYDNERYVGLIDEFAIYSGVLSADRVAAHYNSVLGPCALLQADIVRDCKVDFLDFAELAATWALCNDPELIGIDPDCVPNW